MITNTDNLKRDLASLVGAENVSSNFFKFSEYCLMHVSQKVFGINKVQPFVVVRPVIVDQLVEVVKFSYRNKIPLYVRGGGTGYSGGANPTFGGIVLEMTGLNKVLKVDKIGGYVTCQAGISVVALNSELKKFGLWWPHDPGSREWATVGGAISTLGVGTFSTRYGYAPNMVASLTLVTPEGTLVKLGSKVRHHTTMYNLIETITSAEGTLGVIVDATLKVYKIPPSRKVGIALFDDFDSTVSSCYELVSNGLYPESLMIEDVLRFVSEGLSPFFDLEDERVRSLNLDTKEAALIYSYAGEPTIVDFELRKTEELLKDKKANIVKDLDIINAYWKSKTELPSWPKEEGINIKIHSFVPAIPLSEASKFNRVYKQLASESGLSMTGARYYVILPSMECTVSPSLAFNDDDPKQIEAYESFTTKFSKAVQEMGGAPSSTLGMGIRLAKVLRELTDQNELEIMWKVKKAFDPNETFNPGRKLMRDEI